MTRFWHRAAVHQVGVTTSQFSESTDPETQFLTVVLITEGGLPLPVEAMIRSDSVASPAIRHFIAHLHRAAHQVSRAIWVNEKGN